MDARSLEILFAAEEELVESQQKNANRNRAIALTHVQTAILWLHKERIDEERIEKEKNIWRTDG